MMPAAFIGHGSPMNAITQTTFSSAWKALGARLPKPSAILCISAHWYVEGVAVTAMEHPPTIHDFYGFPRALHEVQYPAPGDPALARDIIDLLAPVRVDADQTWGLDHGTWSILRHSHPQGDIPVVQLAIDATQPPAFHYDLGVRLAPLRERGVFILGSGNLVHNLRMIADRDAKYEWAQRFDRFVRRALESGDISALIDYERHPDAALAAPTPEHFLPLLYVAGLRATDERLDFIVDGCDLASISMTAFTIGA